MFYIYLLIGLLLILASSPTTYQSFTQLELSPPTSPAFYTEYLNSTTSSPTTYQSFTQLELSPPTSSAFYTEYLNSTNNNCSLIDDTNLFWFCKNVAFSCPNICIKNDEISSLTVIEEKGGYIYRVYTDSIRYESVYNITSNYSIYQIIFADVNMIVCIGNKTKILFNYYDQSITSPSRDIENNFAIDIFVEYDDCSKLLYAIQRDNEQYSLVTFSPTPGDVTRDKISKISPDPVKIVDAAIDFKNNIMYIVIWEDKEIRIQSADLKSCLFTNFTQYPLPQVNKSAVVIKVNPTKEELYFSLNMTLYIINIKSKIKKEVITKCQIVHFDFDDNFIYFSCEGSKNISKINITNYDITSFTKDFFTYPPKMFKTKQGKNKECPKETFKLEGWIIPCAAGAGGVLITLIPIIIIICLCRKSSNSSPPLPPDFTGFRISDKMTEDNYYTDLEVFEATPEINKKNYDEAPTLPALRTESIYMDLADPSYHIITRMENQDLNLSELDEITHL